jgi:hypothetical protein
VEHNANTNICRKETPISLISSAKKTDIKADLNIVPSVDKVNNEKNIK